MRPASALPAGPSSGTEPTGEVAGSHDQRGAASRGNHGRRGIVDVWAWHRASRADTRPGRLDLERGLAAHTDVVRTDQSEFVPLDPDKPLG
jgi:hypothetical protein